MATASLAAAKFKGDRSAISKPIPPSPKLLRPAPSLPLGKTHVAGQGYIGENRLFKELMLRILEHQTYLCRISFRFVPAPRGSGHPPPRSPG